MALSGDSAAGGPGGCAGIVLESDGSFESSLWRYRATLPGAGSVDAGFFPGIAPLKGQVETLAFSAAAAAIDRQDVSALNLLLDDRLDPNANDSEGRTLLMSAAGVGFADGVRLLLRSGADVSARTHDGLSALMHAAMALSDESARLLLEAGADPDVRTRNGETAIDVAKDRLRPQFTFRSPFSERHIILFLPAWKTNHPVVNRLLHASKERAAASRASR